MKKLIIILVILAAIIFGGIAYATSWVDETVTADELPEAVYNYDGTMEEGLDETALDLFEEGDGNDQYTLVETFVNFVIYDAIKNDLNADYDPLSDDCTSGACQTIHDADYAEIRYAYAHLNDDDQLIVTVSGHRGSYPSFDTAVHLTFDIELDLLEGELTLILDDTHIADNHIKESTLDRILVYADKDAIEDSVTTGTLDLDALTYTYEYSITP